MTDYRKELAVQQQQLIDALLCKSEAPSEVDEEQVRVCAVSLKSKRARVLNKLAGAPGTECGAALPGDMEAYFQKYPGVHPDGGFADLKRYNRFIAMRKLKARFSFLSR
jgi:hypothetical protein